MSETLYHDAVVALAKARHGAGRLESPGASVTCDNPLCGDRITLDLSLADGKVAALAHKTRGCLLTQAAASLIGELAVGADPVALRATAEQAQRLLAHGEKPSLPKLSLFSAVEPVKSRHSCVLLPFEALTQALNSAEKTMDSGSGHIPSPADAIPSGAPDRP